MAGFQRYAVYLAPPADSRLAAFGAAWLGWDPAQARNVAQPAVRDLPVPLGQITEAPRRYGFHGTLKPPFQLAAGTDEAELVEVARRFARGRAGFDIPALRLARIGRFLVLEPVDTPVALTDLASEAVRVFDAFRAPMTAAEADRRRAAGLTPRQEALLSQWGYPFVMEEFRFHLTLTGPLDGATLGRVEAALARRLARLPKAPLPVHEICLFAEREDGFFQVLKRFRLARGAAAS